MSLNTESKILISILTWYLISLTQAEVQSFQAFNIYSKKCLSFCKSETLCHKTCTSYNGKLEWTANNQLKKAGTNNPAKCIEVDLGGALTVGDCSSNRSVQWSCEGSFLRSNHAGYLSWNIERDILEVTTAVKKTGGQWVVYKSDNNICEYSANKSTTTAIPFTQPTASYVERNADQLWPRGIYTLPKASSGCPGSTNFTWKEGWVFQDLDDTGEIKTKSSLSFNMAANIDEFGNVKRWFCSKNSTKNDSIRPLWPKGTYCIYNGVSVTSDCPATVTGPRLSKGFASWDNNKYVLNNSKKKGKVPHGRFTTGGSTSIYFCCQSNNDPNIPMTLPTDQPFYLLAYLSSVCQKVKWATVISEFIIYDTKDSGYNSDLHSVISPFNFDRKDPKVYYCYYQGCNHTINSPGNKGEINFPESPFMDITSQSCSWRIQMPPGYIITLQFTQLDMSSGETSNCSNQFVEVFEDDYTQRNKSVGKWCGKHSPFTFTSLSRSVLLVLKIGKNISNSTGFRLRYKGISAEETTTEKTQLATLNIESTTNIDSASTINIGSELKSVKPASASKDKQKFPTIFVVVPLVIIALVLTVSVAAFIIIKKRKKNDNKSPITLQNNRFDQENAAQRGELNEDNNGYVSLYERVDMELVEHKRAKQQPKDINPLYESSEQVQYSSTINVLYGCNDS